MKYKKSGQRSSYAVRAALEALFDLPPKQMYAAKVAVKKARVPVMHPKDEVDHRLAAMIADL